MVKEAKIHLTPLIDSGLSGDYLAVAFDVRMYYIELALLSSGSIMSVADHVKNIRLIAQYLINEKASVQQVLSKASELITLAGEDFWKNATVTSLEYMREDVRDLMQFLGGKDRNRKFDIDISDESTDSDYVPESTVIDIRTYREKVIDYLMDNLESKVIKKIYNLEPINDDDLKELEHILWHELGTHEEYVATTHVENLAVFVRSLIGLNQEAVNEKFGEYLNGNLLNSMQQEFVKTIINYARENGDISLEDMVNTEPFNNYDLSEVFGTNLITVVSIVNTLHGTITAA